MTVVDTLDKFALRRGTTTESGRRRRGQIWFEPWSIIDVAAYLLPDMELNMVRC